MNSKETLSILVIDDEKVVRESFRYFLEDNDYRVFEAENGKSGLEIFNRESPDVVLVDLRMPEVDGLEVLGTITQTSPDTPVIIVSGTGQISDSVEALHLGAWDYILKPVSDLTILQYAIDKALERVRLIRENRTYQEHLENEVTRRTKALKRSEQHLRAIYEAADNVAFVTTDLAGKDSLILTFSPGAEHIFGYKEADVIGQPVSMLHPPEIVENFAAMQAMIQKGKKGHTGEITLLRKSGEQFPAMFTLHPLFDAADEIIGTLGISIDISERKRTEEQLKKRVFR